MSGELDAGWRGYRELVASRAKEGKLMTLQTLSSSFPADSEQAGLAYAQSGAVVEFIIQHYGEDAMAKLLEIFSEGALYDEALKEALGVDTWELDNAWRQSIGAQPLEIPTTSTGETSPSTEAPVEAAVTPPLSEESPSPASEGLTLPCLGSSLTGVIVLGLFALFRARGNGPV